MAVGAEVVVCGIVCTMCAARPWSAGCIMAEGVMDTKRRRGMEQHSVHVMQSSVNDANRVIIAASLIGGTIQIPIR